MPFKILICCSVLFCAASQVHMMLSSLVPMFFQCSVLFLLDFFLHCFSFLRGILMECMTVLMFSSFAISVITLSVIALTSVNEPNHVVLS